MRILLSFLTLAFLFISCDDGDVITAELDFDDTFEVCGDATTVFYKVKTDPPETLSLEIDITYDELVETETDSDGLLYYLVDEAPSYTISSTYPFYYRTYTNDVSDSAFCSAIPPSNLSITNDYVSTSGTASFFITLTEDDDDGIPAELEDDNTDGDDDPSTNPTDTDGDGLPDYIDVDDDGDNVLTSTEIETLTITTQAELDLVRDTDGDGTPDYLDTDDDDDTVLTINEDSNGNLNPADDIDNNNIGADYLNDEVAETYTITEYREHIIEQSFALQLTLTNIVLSILTQDEIDFGTLTTTDSREVTPEF